MNKARNRRMILKVIKKKAFEEKKVNFQDEEPEAPWTSISHALNYWQFLKDLEEGRIKHLDGKKVG